MRGLQYLHMHDYPHGDIHWVSELAHGCLLAHPIVSLTALVPQKNILLDEHGTPKLTDFGISRIDDREWNSTPAQPLVSGYLAFMPPEIRANQTQNPQPKKQYACPPGAVCAPRRTPVRPDSSTDVFSCGIVLLAIVLPLLHAPLSSGLALLEEASDLLAKPQTGSGKASTRKRPPVLDGVPDWLGSAIWGLVLQMTRYEKKERISIDQVAVELEKIVKTGADGFVPVDYEAMDMYDEEEPSQPEPVRHPYRVEADTISKRYTEPGDEDVHPYIKEIFEAIQHAVVEDDQVGREDRSEIAKAVRITRFNMEDQGGVSH